MMMVRLSLRRATRPTQYECVCVCVFVSECAWQSFLRPIMCEYGTMDMCECVCLRRVEWECVLSYVTHQSSGQSGVNIGALASSIAFYYQSIGQHVRYRNWLFVRVVAIRCIVSSPKCGHDGQPCPPVVDWPMWRLCAPRAWALLLCLRACETHHICRHALKNPIAF